MNYEELEQLNAEFAKKSELMTKEFFQLFQKWMKDDPRLTTVNMLSLPTNLIMKLICRFPEFHELFPELPDVYVRYYKPFEKIKEHWGKVSGKEFVDMYEREYQKQFDNWFPSQEEKEEFVKWHKGLQNDQSN